MFKKIISLVIAVLFVFMLASCDNGNPVDSTTDTTQKNPVIPKGDPVVEGTMLKSAVGLADENGVYTVPDGITFICEGAFVNDTSLKEVIIPSSVTAIGSGAFYGCTSLLKVVIPDSVTSLGTMAFYGCLALEEVTLSSSVTELLADTFYYCQSLEEIDIPSGVVSIGPSCFYGCLALESVTLPQTLKSVGSSAFTGCITLRNVEGLDKTGITAVSDLMFSSCTALTKVKLPETVKTIGAGAFMYCSNLTNINIPEGVTDIGMMALNYTPWYRENTDRFFVVGDGVLIKSTYNPNSADVPGTLDLSSLEIKSIGNSCFANIAAANYSSSYGYQYYNNIKTVIIPEGVMNIGSGAFFGCVGMENVTLPSTLEVVGGSAFYGLLNDGTASGAKFNLEDCTSLENIGAEAFYGCYGIEKVELSKSVKSVGRDAFTSTTAFYSFIDGSRDEGDGENKFLITGDDVLLWVYVAKDKTAVEIPDGVKYIAGGACAGWDSPIVYSDIEESDNSEAIKVKYRITYNVTDIVIPESVLGIGEYAFLRLIALGSVDIPDSVVTIETGAFSQCGSISSVKVGKNLKYLGTYAFEYASISKIDLPEGLEYIGSGAFSQCDSLESLVVPKSVKSLGEAIVDSTCISLTSVYMSPSFRPYVFYTIDVQNPSLMVYYYKETN